MSRLHSFLVALALTSFAGLSPVAAMAAQQTSKATAEAKKPSTPSPDKASKEEASKDGHGHDHHHGHGPSELSLDEGEKKWETDAPLRAAMQSIQQQLSAAIDDIHHDKFSAAQYKELAKQVQRQLLSIVENCQLSPAADAQFHILLAEMLVAVSALEAESGQKKGAVQLLGSLTTYPKYFQHPGWVAIKH